MKHKPALWYVNGDFRLQKNLGMLEPDLYSVKAETKSKAKGAMWAAIRKEEELEYYKTSFYEFVHSDLYVMQIDSFEYNSGKEHGWHNE